MRVNRIANFINNSKTAQSVLKKVDKNPAIWNSVTSFALAAVARPALIGVLPFKEKKDRQTSQASAVAAGVVELAASVALFLPINKSIQKASDNLYKASGTIFKENAATLRQFKSVTNRGIKLISLVPVSLLRFSIVKPIVRLWFGGKNESK